MIRAHWSKYRLFFKRPAGTSRGTLKYKDSWFIHLQDPLQIPKVAIGECGLLKGLSYDDNEYYESMLNSVCNAINNGQQIPELTEYPSIRFGLEMAKIDFDNGAKKVFFDNDFSKGIRGLSINGLIWMGEKSFLLKQIENKILNGYKCLKIKIGSIHFEEELSILKHIREHFKSEEITLRLDANGSFETNVAMDKLDQLSAFDIHSIEQPIMAGLNDELAKLCSITPIPIALDESLIPIQNPKDKIELLNLIRPQYIILKPSFIGGFEGAKEWIDAALKYSIPWWITSALESNIGLNAIAQWASSLHVKLPQGLGTGQLYSNNISSPLQINQGLLYHNSEIKWGHLKD